MIISNVATPPMLAIPVAIVVSSLSSTLLSEHLAKQVHLSACLGGMATHVSHLPQKGGWPDFSAAADAQHPAVCGHHDEYGGFCLARSKQASSKASRHAAGVCVVPPLAATN